MQKVRLIDPDSLPSSGVIQASRVRALLDASEVMTRTEAWAEGENRSHAEKLALALSEAREEAYADGLRDLIAAAGDYRSAATRLEGEVTRILRDCLVRVFDECPAADVLRATITPVLRTVSIDEDVSIVVHPDRAAILENALRQAAEVLAHANIGIETDDRLSAEQCRIYTASDVIDVSVPVVVDRLIGALENHMKPEAALGSDVIDGGQGDE